jgi:hypothetical protein
MLSSSAVSRYYDEAGLAQRSRLTNTRLVADELNKLNKQVKCAFDAVQIDVDAGPGGSLPHVFDFSAADEWIVNHNLGRAVGVDVLNAGGAKIGAEVLQTSGNQVRVYFAVPIAGRVVIT